MNTFKHTLTRYASFLRWLLPDALGMSKGQTLAVLAAGFLGVAFQAQVFGLIVVYAQKFSSGETINLAARTGIELLDFTLDPRHSMGLLVAGSLLVAFLLSLSALCIYFSRRSMLRLARRYEELCSKRVFYLLGRNVDVFSAAEDNPGGESYLFRLVKSDSRFAGRVLRKLLALVVPVLTLAMALAVLIYLESGLTLLIFFLAAGFLLYQYRISKQTAGHSMRFEKLSSEAGGKYKGLIHHFKQQSGQENNPDMVERTFNQGPVKKQLDAYEGRLKAVETSRLVSGLFMALVLGLILLLMGGAIIKQGSGWGRLLVYVVALRFAMTNQQQVFSTITGINRFYPQVRRYFLFIKSFDDQPVKPQAALVQYQLHVQEKKGENVLQDTETAGEVSTGSRLSLIAPLKLNRYSVAFLFRTLLGEDQTGFKSALYASRFVISGQSCPGMPLGKALGLASEAGWQDMRAWFADEKMFATAKEQLPGNLNKPIQQKTWDKLDASLKFILGLISAGNSDCQWILLEARGLYSLGVEQAEFYLDKFKDRITVIVFDHNLEQVGSFAEDRVAVLSEEHLAGLGSPQWFDAARPQIETLLKMKTDGKEKKSGAFVEEDDLDEM
jgi:hypothetical protein